MARNPMENGVDPTLGNQKGGTAPTLSISGREKPVPPELLTSVPDYGVPMGEMRGGIMVAKLRSSA